MFTKVRPALDRRRLVPAADRSGAPSAGADRNNNRNTGLELKNAGYRNAAQERI